jgi:glyoxylase-like metal-dependent hydrolase (beta-lactamase superfamily II)
VVLPIPFELSHVNVYLVRQRDGWLLIDSGIESEACFDAMVAGLASYGIQPGDLRTILLTHMHPDHIGLANRLIEHSGARLLMHEAELEHLNSLLAHGREWATAGLTLGGVPEALQRVILMAVRAMRDIVRPLRPDELLQGGEVIETACDELEIVWTPGHSPGHVCAYGRRSKLLFSGDHILTEITPNISWFLERDTLADFLASLRRLEPYEIDLVLPSHGEPFDGHRAWITETLHHHDERSDKILASLRSEPQTAHELVAGVWDEQFEPFQHYFALFEVLAHLEHLRRRGSVGFQAEPGGAARWHVSPERWA